VVAQGSQSGDEAYVIASPQSPLAFRDYRLFWIARFSSVMATIAMVVVIGWQVYDLARSDYGMTPKQAAFQLGLLGLAQFVPLLLLTPVAGWAADRFERRTVARLANMIDMSIALTLGWLSMHDALTLPLLFVMAALHGVARVFVGPSMSAIAPNIVPPETLPRAIAMSSIAWQSASVVGRIDVRFACCAALLGGGGAASVFQRRCIGHQAGISPTAGQASASGAPDDRWSEIYME
jgi:MFS family permease